MVIPPEYESTLFQPMRNMRAERLNGRLGHFQVVALSDRHDTEAELTMQTFAQSWEGHSFTHDAHELSVEFARFGETVIRRSALHGA